MCSLLIHTVGGHSPALQPAEPERLDESPLSSMKTTRFSAAADAWNCSPDRRRYAERVYMGTNDLIGSAAVYFPKSRTILTGQCRFSGLEYALPAEAGQHSRGCLAERNGRAAHARSSPPSAGVTLSGKEQNGLLYLQSLPYFGSVPRATIAIFVPESRLEKGILSQIELADGMEMELYLHGACMLQTGTSRRRTAAGSLCAAGNRPFLGKGRPGLSLGILFQRHGMLLFRPAVCPESSCRCGRNRPSDRWRNSSPERDFHLQFYGAQTI